MSSWLYKFSVDPSKMDTKVVGVVLFIWLLVVACAVGSVFTHQPRFEKRKQWFWVCVVVFVPVFGLAAYLPFSLKHEGYPFLRRSKHKKTKIPLVPTR
jgi:hypothetical protein